MKFGNEQYSLFVGSFTEEGNLLSQWRGYCTYGKGVSLGFVPSMIVSCAQSERLLLGRCKYEQDEKSKLAAAVLDQVIRSCRDHPTIGFEPYGSNNIFDRLEPQLLTLASLIKHQDFREEKEWRVVMPAIKLGEVSNVQFREGKNSLVPYVDMVLPIDGEKKLLLEQIVLGPTSEEDVAFRSLSNFMRRNTNCKHVYRVRSPYRQL